MDYSLDAKSLTKNFQVKSIVSILQMTVLRIGGGMFFDKLLHMCDQILAYDLANFDVSECI